MNKKLLALAVAGAFVAPAAMANSSNVTIFGTASMSVDHVDGGGNCAAGAATASSDACESRTRVESNTSLIGFKGKEDLGNGLSVHFNIEQTVTLDAGGGTWSSGRNNFVGFAGKSWGSIDFGLIDSPLKKSTGKLDMFGGGHTIADYRGMFVTRDTNVRQTNSVVYSSPKFNGFSFAAQTAAQQESGSSGSPSFWSLSGTYDNGPIFATLAYEHNKKALTTGATTVFDNGGGQTGFGGVNMTTGAGSATAKFTSWRAGFGYNFGVAKVGLAYQSSKVAGSITGGAFTIGGAGVTSVAGAAGQGVDFKRETWHLSGSYNVTKATAIAAQYTRSNKLKSNLAGLDLSSTQANQWTVGVRHDMSKRTNVYALYTKVNNSSKSAYTLGGGASGVSVVSPGANGEDPRAFSVGVVHKF